jgi:catechol 2,3-dioxygenase-like lactoylglutathione lyase family enzyme
MLPQIITGDDAIAGHAFMARSKGILGVSRFDHAVIAVADLDTAIAAYRKLGFDVISGGRHTGRGTHNAIIRFGLDYLELIGIHDQALGLKHGGNVNDLIAYIERAGGGLLGFALATSDLDAIAADWSSDFAPANNPVPMERVRPDGFRLEWRLLIPGGSAWRRPWPFLIQWHTPDRERLARDGPGHHPNGANGVAGVTLVARSVSGILPLYVQDLGLTVEVDGAAETHFRLGSFQIDLLAPASGPAAEALDREGEGLYEVELRVSDLSKAVDATGVNVDSTGRLVIPPARACGARLVLVAAR